MLIERMVDQYRTGVIDAETTSHPPHSYTYWRLTINSRDASHGSLPYVSVSSAALHHGKVTA